MTVAREPAEDRRGEARFPAAFAVVVAAGLYGLLPDELILGTRLVVPVLELVLLGALVAVNPLRLDRETRWSRKVSLLLICFIAGSNLVALVQLTGSWSTPAAAPGPSCCWPPGRCG